MAYWKKARNNYSITGKQRGSKSYSRGLKYTTASKNSSKPEVISADENLFRWVTVK